jgi:hypothetical protein
MPERILPRRLNTPQTAIAIHKAQAGGSGTIAPAELARLAPLPDVLPKLARHWP